MAGTAAAGAVVGGGGVVRRHQRRAGARPGRRVRDLSRLLLLSFAGKPQSYTRSGGSGGASQPSPHTSRHRKYMTTKITTYSTRRAPKKTGAATSTARTGAPSQPTVTQTTLAR